MRTTVEELEQCHACFRLVRPGHLGSVMARDKDADEDELPPHTVPPGAARKRIEALAAAIPIEE